MADQRGPGELSTRAVPTAPGGTLEEAQPDAGRRTSPDHHRPPRSLLNKAGKVSRYPVLILLLIQADDQMDRYLLAALFPAIKEEFRLSDTQLGLLSSAFVIVAAIGVVPFGILVDRYIRVRVAALGEAVRSVAMIFSGLATSYPFLFAARSFLGAAEASYSPAAFSLISDYYPVDERGKMLGYFQIGAILGFVALPIGVFIGDTYGWRTAFHFLAIQGFVLAMLAWRLPEPERGRQDREAAGLASAEAGIASAIATMRSRQAFAAIVRVPSVLIAVVATALSTFFTAGLGIWTVTFLVRFHDMSLTQASLTTGLLGIGAVIGAFSGGVIGDRLVQRGVANGRLYVAGTANLAGVVLLVPAFAVDSTPLMIVLFAFGAVTLTMPNPPLSAVQADVIHPDLRGRSVSVRSLLNTGAAASSPLVLGLLSDGIGLRSAFLWLLPLMGLGGLVILLLGPRFLTPDIERMQRQLAGTERVGSGNDSTPVSEPDSGIPPDGDSQAPGASGSRRRPWLGAVPALLVALTGLALIVHAWATVSDETNPADQISWIVSGVAGIALVLAGASMLTLRHGRRVSERLQRLDRRLEALAGEVRSRAADTAETSGDARFVVVRGGETYHRESCPVLEGKAGARRLRAATVRRRGLRPCALCDPPGHEDTGAHA